MKIDSHQHFWKYNRKDYGWIGDDLRTLKKDFLPKDLEPILIENDFEGSVVVQARQSVEETEWLLHLAEKYPFIKGVVGWVDLCSPTSEAQLKQYAKSPFFKGVRHVVHDERDDRFMLRDDFQRGIASLQKFNLTYDLLLFPKHIRYAIELVEKFPNQPFVVDHIAKPPIKNQLLSPWNEDMGRLANFENVYCKLSGMVTEADIGGFEKEDFIPYLELVYQAFGADRLMIGSDWPVCTVSKDYMSVMNIVKNFIKDLPNHEQEKILGDNCVKFYGIQ